MPAHPIVSERYVSLTTRRRNGETVSTPVWIAALGDGRACCTTGSTSGKVKRIRNDPSVTLRPCDSRGRVAADAVEVCATAQVVTGEAYEQVRAAVKAKYGWQFAMVSVVGAVGRLLRRPSSGDAGLVFDLAAN